MTSRRPSRRTYNPFTHHPLVVSAPPLVVILTLMDVCVVAGNGVVVAMVKMIFVLSWIRQPLAAAVVE